jgi:predicted RNase H-like nuclease (RuvC/YqgF family)
MTEQPEPSTSRDVPDADNGILPRKNRMSDTVSRSEFEKVLRQLQRRKGELAELQNKFNELQSTQQQLIQERDEAITIMEQQTEQFQRFTNENELAQENAMLRGELKQIYVEDAIYAALPEGMNLQQGVSIQEILGAAGTSLDDLEDLTPEVIQEAIGKAHSTKPYLFFEAAGAQAGEQPAQAGEGEVRQQTAPPAPAPSLRAFGAQAVGGGSAPEAARDPAKTVDWTNPAAVNSYQKSLKQ